MYRQGTLGFDAGGRRLRMLDAYVEARAAARNGIAPFPEEQGLAFEAMSTSDFGTYLGTILRYRFINRFEEISGAWPQYTRDFSVEDFGTYTSSRFGRFPDIPEKSLNGPYEHLAIVEGTGPSLSLREWGANFGLTRQLVLSDRLQRLTDLPDRFAEAMARTVSKEAAVNVFQANPTMYDGNALFSVAHANKGTTALTADQTGMNLLITAEQAIDAQTDDEGYKIVQPQARHKLIIPREYRWIAAALNDLETTPNGSNQLVPNLVRGRYDIVEEPYFTDANNWYMTVDTSGELAFMASVTLNGNTQPFLGLRDPSTRGVLGGEDPYSFEFDEIEYKIRHDFNFVTIEWRGIFGAIVP